MRLLLLSCNLAMLRVFGLLVIAPLSLQQACTGSSATLTVEECLGWKVRPLPCVSFSDQTSCRNCTTPLMGKIGLVALISEMTHTHLHLHPLGKDRCKVAVWRHWHSTSALNSACMMLVVLLCFVSSLSRIAIGTSSYSVLFNPALSAAVPALFALFQKTAAQYQALSS